MRIHFYLRQKFLQNLEEFLLGRINLGSVDQFLGTPWQQSLESHIKSRQLHFSHLKIILWALLLKFNFDILLCSYMVSWLGPFYYMPQIPECFIFLIYVFSSTLPLLNLNHNSGPNYQDNNNYHYCCYCHI